MLDAEGNRVSLADSIRGETTYTYDALDRLVGEEGPGVDATYTYDATGNRTTKTDGGLSTTYAYDAADQMLAVGTQSFSYDANGSRTSRNVSGDLTTYVWNADNLLASVTTSQTAASYTYDGEGRRVATTTDGVMTEFDLDVAGQMELVLAEESSEATASYFYGAGLVSRETSEGTTYYLTDALGSTRLLTDEAGEVTGESAYDAFGVELDANGEDTRFGFTGQSEEAAGLQFMRARFYEPATGRFVSVDPVPGELAMPATLNPYVYCANNPVMMVDPEGEWFGVDDALYAIGGAAVAVAERAIVDMATGRSSSFGDYAATAVGGAVGGWIGGNLGGPAGMAYGGSAGGGVASTLWDAARGKPMSPGMFAFRIGWSSVPGNSLMEGLLVPRNVFAPGGRGAGGGYGGGGGGSWTSVNGGRNGAVYRTAVNGRSVYVRASGSGAGMTYQVIEPPRFKPYTYGRLYRPLFAK